MKLKAPAGTARVEEDEPSRRNCIPGDDPWLGCFIPTDISVITAAIPRAIPNFERNELPVLAVSLCRLPEAISEFISCPLGVILDVSDS